MKKPKETKPAEPVKMRGAAEPAKVDLSRAKPAGRIGNLGDYAHAPRRGGKSK